MQPNNNMQTQYEEDEIDLRELFKTIWKSKRFIIVITLIVTMLSIVYALIVTPTYEVRAIVEVGKHKTGLKENLLEDGPKLAQRLSIEYIDLFENVKDKNSTVKSIAALKKNPSFIEIEVESFNNKLAKDHMKLIIDRIEKDHLVKINEIKENKRYSVAQLKRKIERVKNDKVKGIDEEISFLENNELSALSQRIKYSIEHKVPTLKMKIAFLDEDSKKYEKQLDLTRKNLQKLQNKDASLSALRLAQMQSLESQLSTLKLTRLDFMDEVESIEKNELEQLKNKREQLILKDIPTLKRKRENIINNELLALNEQLKVLEISIADYNFINSAVVGDLIISDHPVKPKKKLIVIVAFVTGLILSIFLVFFLEFIRGFKEENASPIAS